MRAPVGVERRAELAGGDHRALYLGWLLRLQRGDVDESDEEPPCPPGLRSLSAPLEALVDFLRIDRDLVTAAATGSAALCEPRWNELGRWLGSLPDEERTALLVRFIEGAEPHLRAEMLRRFERSRERSDGDVAARTAGLILATSERLREERERLDAERAAKERAHRERAAAETRAREVDALVRREVAAWAEVDALIATKLPRRYNDAVKRRPSNPARRRQR